MVTGDFRIKSLVFNPLKPQPFLCEKRLVGFSEESNCGECPTEIEEVNNCFSCFRAVKLVKLSGSMSKGLHHILLREFELSFYLKPLHLIAEKFFAAFCLKNIHAKVFSYMVFRSCALQDILPYTHSCIPIRLSYGTLSSIRHRFPSFSLPSLALSLWKHQITTRNIIYM